MMLTDYIQTLQQGIEATKVIKTEEIEKILKLVVCTKKKEVRILPNIKLTLRLYIKQLTDTRLLLTLLLGCKKEIFTLVG